MRITGGEMGGRRLKVPARGVRPTQDRVRESLFNILGNLVPAARVLDLYAGSGAFGIEAWSRGAERVVWVEKNRRNHAVLRENVTKLCGGTDALRTCICSDALKFLARSEETFDIVFADPPYDKQDQLGRLERLLECITDNECLAESGLLVYEMSTAETFELPPRWRIIRDKQWGETRVLIMGPNPDSSPDFVP